MIPIQITNKALLLGLILLLLASASLVATDRQADPREERKKVLSVGTTKSPEVRQQPTSSLPSGANSTPISSKEVPITGEVALPSVPVPTFQSSLLPSAGEQIKWQVLSAGGGNLTSAGYKLGCTVGLAVSDITASSNYKINPGFWQNLAPASCCVGKRGNVNMAGGIDAADLSSLVSYLTGGSFIPTCTDAANANGLGGVDATDLSSLVSFLTGGSFVLVNCP